MSIVLCKFFNHDVRHRRPIPPPPANGPSSTNNIVIHIVLVHILEKGGNDENVHNNKYVDVVDTSY
jgi:hypothetical protein